MSPITAQSADDLLNQLARIDISVPLRTEGRTTEHVERWSAARFLSTYARSTLVDYPLKVIPRDRPDLLLVLRGSKVGVEMTEAVPTNWARASALHDHREYENVMLIPHCAPGEAMRPSKEIERIARGEEMSEPWMGDSAEREWAEVMLHFAIEKAAKLTNPGFSRFDVDWLLIYDNWPLPAVDEELASSFLREMLAARDPKLPFQAIFVEGSKHFWHFEADHVMSTAINDLWQDS